MDIIEKSFSQTDEALAIATEAQGILTKALDERDALQNEIGHVRHSYDLLQERMEQEIERAKGPLTAECGRLTAQNARLVAALRGVIAVADRDTDEFNRAKSALALAEEAKL